MSLNTFQRISGDQWMEKIQKDLRDQSPEDLIWNLGNIQITPFVHPDLWMEKVHKLNRSTSESSKVPAAFVQNKEAVQSALNLGVGCLLLSPGQQDLHKDWLEGVHRDLIDLYVVNEDLVSIRDLHTTIEEVTENLLQIESKEFIPVALSDNFYLNVATIRALHVCLNQIVKDNPSITYPKLGAFYCYQNDEDMATNLLRAMSALTAGLLAGADHLGQQGAPDEESERLLTNSVHLLLLESGIPLNEDCLSGAYYFEKMTMQLAEMMWTRLHEKNNQYE